MKKLLIILSAILMVSHVFGQHSIFSVFSDDGTKFTAFLDGEKLNSEPQSRISDVKYKNAWCKLRIEMEKPGIPAMSTDVNLKDMDGNYVKTSFIIKQNNKGVYKIKTYSYETYLPIEDTEDTYVAKSEPVETKEVIEKQPQPENTEENVTLKISANEDGNSSNSSVSMSIKADDGKASLKIEINGEEGAENGNATVEIEVNEATVTSSSSEVSYSYSSSSSSSSSSVLSQNSGSSNTKPAEKQTVKKSAGCESAVTPSEFKQIMSDISSKDMEDSKLTTAKDIAKNKCLNSTQIAEIMKQFSIEEDRLSFAVFAYKYVVDKDNYYKTYDAFIMEMTIDDLKEQLGI